MMYSLGVYVCLVIFQPFRAGPPVVARLRACE
jgi:hypothetical protein